MWQITKNTTYTAAMPCVAQGKCVVGQFVNSSLSAANVSIPLSYGWYAVEGAAAYAPAEGGLKGRYFSLAAALTPASVAQAAARYLGVTPAVVTFAKRTPAPPKAPA